MGHESNHSLPEGIVELFVNQDPQTPEGEREPLFAVKRGAS